MGSRIKNTDFSVQPRLQRRHLLHWEDRTLEKVSAKRTERTLPQMNAQKGERAEEKRRKKAQREIGIVLKANGGTPNGILLFLPFSLSPCLPFGNFRPSLWHAPEPLVVITCSPFAHEYCLTRFCNLKFLFVSLSPLEGRRYLAFLAVLIDQYPDGGSAREIICADKHFYAPDTTPKSAIKKRERNFFHGWAGEEQSQSDGPETVLWA